MDKSNEIVELVSGYRAWADSEDIGVESRTEAPAATTTFCAFTVSYLASKATVDSGC
ncbi:hypothetical protein PWG71_17060 [Nocardiopsis sp. N85]|uniref:hypothetical protein n=1 Tax=Nocardiopsis sp. N85 TaxID=3029400 RepID=UPI00237F591B|nr:hypothetical protein [Nocardiopsis sp. N85]MDE3723103.1 hypothetical protein [Nocardiopsis sp. N85]